MKFNSILPEFYVSNFEKSLKFYAEILPFKIEYDRENPRFAFLSYQGTQIMIQEFDPNEDDEYITGKFEYPLGRGINFQIDTDNVQELANSLKENNYPILRDISDSWYRENDILHGCRQILVQDPDGYLLRFSQGIGEKPAS
ncbi:MAG TPA: VOC family protein [Patescibacteria group bacterium]|nr:VOC family protein [Patescibacteria group bacterium]